MEIRITLDEEDEFDPVDPGGAISIVSNGQAISARYVYLDSWLEALITGLKEIEAGRAANVDLIEEPDPLEFDPLNGGLKITYRNTTVMVKSIDEFREALRKAAKDFLDQMKPYERTENNQLLNSIRTFIQSE
jgi:hypothetical protein